jgi:hypothetical protein
MLPSHCSTPSRFNSKSASKSGSVRGGRFPDAADQLRQSPGLDSHLSGLTDPNDAEDFTRRLKKGVGADVTASGATRVAGTMNYKRKYEPDFPKVAILKYCPRPCGLCCLSGIPGASRRARAGETRNSHPPSSFPQARECGTSPEMA